MDHAGKRAAAEKGNLSNPNKKERTMHKNNKNPQFGEIETRHGYTYAAINSNCPNLFKIGCSQWDRYSYGNPGDEDMNIFLRVADTIIVKHKEYGVYKEGRLEWKILNFARQENLLAFPELLVKSARYKKRSRSYPRGATEYICHDRAAILRAAADADDDIRAFLTEMIEARQFVRIGPDGDGA